MEALQFFGQDSLRRHGFAVLAVALGLALKLYLGDANGQNAALPLLAFSVMLGAWYGGLGPGLLATGLGAALAAYFIIPPIYSFRIADTGGWLQLTVFASEGILISLLCEARRRSMRALSVSRASERSAMGGAAALGREVERLKAELARTRSDLQYFTHAVRQQARQAGQAHDMARGLIDYADAMGVERCEPVNCNEIVQAAIAQTAAEITHDPLPTILAHEAQLRALFVRLLTRARSANQTAHIAAGCQGDGWTFCIYYSGAPVLCDPIARRIVEGHDGTLAVESRPGRGSIARIHIPRRPR